MPSSPRPVTAPRHRAPSPRPVTAPRHRALLASLCASLSLLSLSSAPPARAGQWVPSLSGPMTTKDTGTSGTQTFSDEWDSDIGAASTVESADPFIDYGFPFLLPLIDQVNRSTLSGTGFDTTGYTYDLFGAFGSPCHEDSTASPVVTFTWVPDPNLPSDPPPRGPCTS